MSTAVIRARSALASLAFISVKALALSGHAIADTLTRALFIVMVVGSSGIRSTDKRLFEWANALAAVSGHPAIPASARVVFAAVAMARAKVGARRKSACQKSKSNKKLHYNYL
jgi:hypothetical protein